MATLHLTQEELWWLVDAYQELWDRTLGVLDVTVRTDIQNALLTCQEQGLDAIDLEFDLGNATLFTMLIKQDLDLGRSNRGRAILMKLFAILRAVEDNQEVELSQEWENVLKEVQDGHDASTDDGTEDRAIA